MHVMYDSSADLADALRRAAAAHGKHEEEIGHPDPDWPDWYAQYMVDEQAGSLDQAMQRESGQEARHGASDH